LKYRLLVMGLRVPVFHAPRVRRDA
jgi:hypothetical protein